MGEDADTGVRLEQATEKNLDRRFVESAAELVDAIRYASNTDEAKAMVREFLRTVDATADGEVKDAIDLGTPLNHAINSLELTLPDTLQKYYAQQRCDNIQHAETVAWSDREWDQAIADDLQRIRNDAMNEVLRKTDDVFRIANRLQSGATLSLGSALDGSMAAPLAVAEYLRIGQYTLPDDLARFVMLNPRIPALVPLLNHGHIVVQSDTYDAHLEGFIRQLVLGALWNTGPGELAIEIFDPKLRPIMGPFAELRKAGTLFPGRVTRTDELERSTDRLLREARRISDLFRGRDMNLGNLKKEAEDIAEVYHLVIVLDFPLGFDDRTYRNVQLLLDAGPLCGISFLVHHNTSIKSEADSYISDIVSKASTIQISSSNIMPAWDGDLGFRADPLPSVDEAIQAIERIVISIQESAAPRLDFLGLHTDDPWMHTSMDGLTAIIGRIGQDPLQITLGSEITQLHNVLVSGAVGQGKSVLLMALVHSIAHRYSPDEVEMYLIDLKEGLTLKPLACETDNTDSYMPHARVIALESDSAFATTVLEHLVFEFEDRAAIMRDYGENLLQYRRIHPDHRMPRILVVIDEFQKLFTSDDYWSTRALSSLVQIAREGRAYGIHLILASQTLSGITGILSQQDGIFAQFPIRLALRNSESESRVVLGSDNREAAELRFRGEVIVNEDFGAVGSNRRGVVADASSREILASLRRGLCSRLHEQPDMRVFDGSVPAAMVEYRKELAELRPQQSERWHDRYAVVGASLSVERTLAGIRLSSNSGGHLAILGHGRKASRRPGIRPLRKRSDDPQDLALGCLLAVLTGLAVQHPDGDAEFVILDLLDRNESAETRLTEVISTLERFGFLVRHHIGQNVSAYFASIVATLGERSPNDTPLYVIGLGLDRVRLTDEEIEPIATDGPPSPRSPAVRSSSLEGLRELIRSGASANARLLAWWSLKASFDEAVGFDGRNHITGFLALGLERSDVYELVGRQIDWRFESNRALLHEVGFGDPEIIVPFAAPSPHEIDRLLTMSGDG